MRLIMTVVVVVAWNPEFFFRKNAQISHLTKIRPVRSQVIPCGRTDGQDPTLIFSRFSQCYESA